MRAPAQLAHLAEYTDQKRLQDAWRDSLRAGEKSRLHDAAIARRCARSVNPSICDLVLKVEASRDKPWTAHTPFNCDRAGGDWEGDIVHGSCRFRSDPSDTRPPFDERRLATQHAAQARTAADHAERELGRGNVRSALAFAWEAERAFAYLMHQLAVLPAEEVDRLLGESLPAMQRLADLQAGQ